MAFTLPTVTPNSGNPATFNDDMDYYLGWMTDFAAELNAAGFPNIPVKFGVNGTVAAPALSWSVDPDTGLWRPGTDQIAISAGGQKMIHARTNGVEINGNMTGTAVQVNAADATGNRLMKVGAFGLGADAINIASLNADDIPTGIYSADGNTIGKPGGDANGQNCVVVHLRRAGTQIERQDAYTQDKHYWRQRIGPALGSTAYVPWEDIPWKVATDQRIENANGLALRFGNGLQICTGSITTLASGAIGVSFPAAFLGQPRIGLAVRSTTARIINAYCTAITASAMNIVAFNSDTRVAAQVDYTAIGKWNPV